MNFSQAEWELLSGANEDWYGLWEALASVRSAVTGIEENEIIPVTRRALESLLDKGLVYLCWFRHRGSVEEPMANSLGAKLLADASLWEPPLSGDRYIAFAATPVGERAWQSSKPPVGESVS